MDNPHTKSVWFLAVYHRHSLDVQIFGAQTAFEEACWLALTDCWRPYLTPEDLRTRYHDSIDAAVRDLLLVNPKAVLLYGPRNIAFP